MEKLKLPSRYLDRLEKESRSFGTPIRIRKSVWEKNYRSRRRDRNEKSNFSWNIIALRIR